MSVHLFCLPRKKSLNLQVEIILGIISVITLHSLIGLNNIVAYSESSTCQISLACWVDSVFTFDFFSNIIWFVSILFRHQTPKKLVWYCFMAKVFCSGEFDIIHCTPEVYIYCSKLSAAYQGDLFTSCENIISCSQTLLLPLPPLVLTLYV